MADIKKHVVIYDLNIAVVLTHPAMYSEDKRVRLICVCESVCMDGWCDRRALDQR